MIRLPILPPVCSTRTQCNSNKQPECIYLPFFSFSSCFYFFRAFAPFWFSFRDVFLYSSRPHVPPGAKRIAPSVLTEFPLVRTASRETPPAPSVRTQRDTCSGTLVTSPRTSTRFWLKLSGSAPKTSRTTIATGWGCFAPREPKNMRRHWSTNRVNFSVYNDFPR